MGFLIPGQPLALECMKREIKYGEHQVDADNKILYEPFPVCEESGQSLMIPYKSELNGYNCTITFDDELYHLFQLYIHQDAPMSCRLYTPIEGSLRNDPILAHKVPIAFSFRGNLQESHLDVDPNLNMLIHTSLGVPTTGIAYSHGPVFNSVALEELKKQSEISMAEKALEEQADNGEYISGLTIKDGFEHDAALQRIVIGDKLTLQMDVRWPNTPELPYTGSHFTAASTFLYCVFSAIATATLVVVLFNNFILPRRTKLAHIAAARLPFSNTSAGKYD